MKILAIDIETSPNLAHVWGLWDQNVSLSQLRESTEMLCFAAKWLGAPKKDTRFYSSHKDGRGEMVQAAHDLLDEADVLLHFNGRSFDVKHLNREFIEHGFWPPSPFAQIDLLLTVKKHFRFPSNKLEYVSRTLGLAGKVKHEGHELWVKCMAGDPKAWARMEKYNRQDVYLLEDLYTELLPWISGHPNRHLYNGDPDACPKCGGTHLQRRGYAYTSLSKFVKMQCQDCGSYFRSSKRAGGVEVQGAVL